MADFTRESAMALAAEAPATLRQLQRCESKLLHPLTYRQPGAPHCQSTLHAGCQILWPLRCFHPVSLCVHDRQQSLMRCLLNKYACFEGSDAAFASVLAHRSLRDESSAQADVKAHTHVHRSCESTLLHPPTLTRQKSSFTVGPVIICLPSLFTGSGRQSVPCKRQMSVFVATHGINALLTSNQCTHL